MSEQPDCYTISTPKARKDHKCCECRGTISKGEVYHVFSGIWDGRAGTYKTCADCESHRNDIVDKRWLHAEDYPCFGHLYEDVFEGDDAFEIKRFMDTRRKRNAPESSRGWMEKREQELETPKV